VPGQRAATATPHPSGAPADPHAPLSDDEFWAAIGSPARRRLVETALACFAEQGFHATSTREIAQRSGLSPSAVYFHFATKSDLLAAIALWGHHTSLRTIEDALVGDDPAERLRSVIRALVVWHVEHLELARVIAYEQSALPEADRARLRPFRRRFIELVEAEAGSTAATRAVLSMCTDIARWYRRDRGPGAERLADEYADIAALVAAPRQASGSRPRAARPVGE
jgi:AcrR family transcriptional regulator